LELLKDVFPCFFAPIGSSFPWPKANDLLKVFQNEMLIDEGENLGNFVIVDGLWVVRWV